MGKLTQSEWSQSRWGTRHQSVGSLLESPEWHHQIRSEIETRETLHKVNHPVQYLEAVLSVRLSIGSSYKGEDRTPRNLEIEENLIGTIHFQTGDACKIVRRDRRDYIRTVRTIRCRPSRIARLRWRQYSRLRGSGVSCMVFRERGTTGTSCLSES